MPKAFSEQEKEIIAARLLEQGEKQFSVYGLRKTNVEEIARAAGISKGAFYLFYESKEDLFMDVVEGIEERVRKELMEAVDLPGPSPRARLYSVFKKAVELFSSLPILHYITGGDFELLFRRMPAKKLQDHLSNDRDFFDALMKRCENAGIPIRVSADRIVSLFYPLVMSILHTEDIPQGMLGGNLDILLELIAAYCVGEVEIQLQNPGQPINN